MRSKWDVDAAVVVAAGVVASVAGLFAGARNTW